MTLSLSAFAWILLGLFYCNGLEWIIHKKLLHEHGKKKNSAFRFHWEHHNLAKKHDGKDPDYETHGITRESYFVLILILLHIPTILISPFFYLTMVAHGLYYLYVHRKFHMDLHWARVTIPWHWDHHMGPKECVEANWCVTFPLFDYIMGTRKPYYNTNRYFMDMARKSVRIRNEKDIRELE